MTEEMFPSLPKSNHYSSDSVCGSAGKLDSMLRHFASGMRIHRFQAENLGDHCLPTTISDLQSMHSIQFSREWILVPNRFGTSTRVKHYWLEGSDLEIARQATNYSRRPK